MRSCPDTDALVTLGDALDWDMAAGLQHLQTCADCRARIDALHATRAAFMEMAPIEDATLARITHALGAEARAERGRARAAHRWASAVEALLAGAAAPLVLVSSGVQIGSVTAGLLTVALGAALFSYGRRLRLYAA